MFLLHFFSSVQKNIVTDYVLKHCIGNSHSTPLKCITCGIIILCTLSSWGGGGGGGVSNKVGHFVYGTFC